MAKRAKKPKPYKQRILVHSEPLDVPGTSVKVFHYTWLDDSQCYVLMKYETRISPKGKIYECPKSNGIGRESLRLSAGAALAVLGRILIGIAGQSGGVK